MCASVPASDPAVARERIKLSQLRFNAGELEDALEPLRRGMLDLEPFVDAGTDVDFREALAMQAFLHR